MRERRVVPRHGRSRRLFVLVLVGLVFATACAQPDGAEVTALPLTVQASEPPLPPSSDRLPANDARPEPARSEARPSSASSLETPEDVQPLASTADAATPSADPVGLQIPAIGLDSDLVDLGLEADGTLEVPSSGFPAGWYRGSPRPGELGPAVIAGHVDWGGHPGVFFDLRNLSQGDEILVSRQDGRVVRFEVTRVERFAKSEFPTSQVYGDLDHAGLRLITCGGNFNPEMRSYEDNLVIFAELAAGSRSRGR